MLSILIICSQYLSAVFHKFFADICTIWILYSFCIFGNENPISVSPCFKIVVIELGIFGPFPLSIATYFFASEIASRPYFRILVSIASLLSFVYSSPFRGSICILCWHWPILIISIYAFFFTSLNLSLFNVHSSFLSLFILPTTLSICLPSLLACQWH